MDISDDRDMISHLWQQGLLTWREYSAAKCRYYKRKKKREELRQ